MLNYEFSDIKALLNNEFYSSAFALKDDYIIDNQIDNSASTTASKTNPYACDDVNNSKTYKNSSFYWTRSPNHEFPTIWCVDDDTRLVKNAANFINGSIRLAIIIEFDENIEIEEYN